MKMPTEALVHLKTEERRLGVLISTSEHADVGQELGELLQRRHQADAERTAAAAAYRERLKDLDTKIDALRDVAATGRRPKPVTCQHLADWHQNRLVVVRTDTDEIVEERALTPQERAELEQLGMFAGDTELPPAGDTELPPEAGDDEDGE